jgi:hypothetical protein
MRTSGIESMASRFPRLLLGACVAIPCVLLSGNASAQLATKIAAANGAGSDIYSVAFSGSSGTTTTLNTDSNAHTGIRSLVYRPNQDTGTIDLIAADTSRGEVLLYTNGTGNSIVIWGPGSPVANALEGKGPLRPDGMSIDGSGNLYVTSSASGSKIAPELWVFPRNAAGPLPGGYALPRLVDNDFGKDTQLVETISVRVSGAITAAGNLLLATSAPNQVLVYSAASLQGVLGGAGETDPLVLIPAARFPVDSVPGGMDLWPLDGSLLVTSYDRVLRFTQATRLPDFATGLGNGKQNKFKIRTTRTGATAIAVLADNANGRLLEYTAPGVLAAVVTSGVNRPQALAATNAGAVSAACYESPDGCDALGNVIRHRALNVPPQSTSGFLLQEPCVVNVDPRFDTATGTWNDVPLPINSVCPGFGASVIPAYLRGGSGPSGKGFAIVSSTSSFLLAEGAEVASEFYSENLLGAKPACTAPYSAEIVTWAPTEGEGSIVEANGQVDATVGCRNPLLAGTRGASDWTFGLVLDTDSSALPGANTTQRLHNFSGAKYVSLLATVQAAELEATLKSELTACLAASQFKFEEFRYDKALTLLSLCEEQARTVWTQSPGSYVGTEANPNPYGEIVTRIANLGYTIRFRQLQP